MENNKEMKENIKKTRTIRSTAVGAAKIQRSRIGGTEKLKLSILKENFGTIKEKVSDVIEKPGKTDIAKKACQLGEEVSKSAKGVTDSISEQSGKLGKSGAFQTIFDTTEMIKQELETQSIQGRVYRSPEKLRKRVEVVAAADDRIFEANMDATGVELHKYSKFYQSWEI